MITKINLIVIVFLFSLSSPVYAYLDAGSGSYVLQMLLAGIAAILFSIKIYWHKLKLFFIQRFRKADKDHY